MPGKLDPLSRRGKINHVMAIFDEPSFCKRVRRVIDGLKSPRHSGEHRYALFQLRRLTAHLAAVLVPAIALLLICILPGVSQVESSSLTVLPDDSEPVWELDPLQEDLPVVQPPDDSLALTGELVPAMSIGAVTASFESEVGPSPDASRSLRLSPVRCTVAVKSAYSRRFLPDKNAGQRGEGGHGGELAVLRALRWIKQHQEPDGSWSLASGGGPGSGSVPAMTGLALLTFLAHGETPAPDCIEFGLTVQRGISWLIDNQLENGRFPGQDKHEYGHPIAAYALCEAFGMTRYPDAGLAAQRATDVIIRGQNESGGWNYNCRKSDRDDTSYMGWCVQALKAARIAGVRAEGIDNALAKSVQGVKGNASLSTGGFGYTAPGRHHLTSAAVLSLQLAGAGNSPEARQGMVMLDEATCRWDAPWGNNPIYYWYYITQAKLHHSEEAWETWRGAFEPQFVANQTVLPGASAGEPETGYWEAVSPREHCQSLIYNTTLCTLALETPYRMLPTYKTERGASKEGLNFAEDENEVKVTIRLLKTGSS